MRSTLAQIIELQRQYTWQNTPAMQQRGLLVRDSLPDELKASVLADYPDLDAEGGDGTGRKAQVPWVRVYNPEFSTAATNGWYAVYLFHGDAGGVTLSLNQGTTQPEAGAFRRLPVEDLQGRVEWARDRLELPLPAGRLLGTVDLAGAELADGYELGHVAGFRYVGELPGEAQLVEDLRLILGLLQRLYGQISFAAPPGAPNPDIDTLSAEIDKVAGKPVRPGVPRQLSKAKRDAIEQHAMFLARDLLEGDGWEVEDTHLTESFDFIARRDGQKLYVEVKGTTTAGEAVILTKNEVKHHRSNPGEACLIVVRDIIMLEAVDEPTCTGGIREMWLPWTIGDEHLTAMAYAYRVRPPTPALSRVAPEGIRTTASSRSK